MKVFLKNINKWVIACLFILIAPVVTFAQQLTVEEEAAKAKQTELYGEIGIGLLFVVSVVLFLVFKSKHDKKQREKQLRQMEQIQANRRKAA
ncbi:MAG: hypothetical protein ABI388_09790 [Bacteroidia bacterium]